MMNGEDSTPKHNIYTTDIFVCNAAIAAEK